MRCPHCIPAVWQLSQLHGRLSCLNGLQARRRRGHGRQDAEEHRLCLQGKDNSVQRLFTVLCNAVNLKVAQSEHSHASPRPSQCSPPGRRGTGYQAL